MRDKFGLVVILSLLAVGLTVIFGWWLLSSPKIANSSFAINLRHNYYSVLWPKLGLSLKSLPYEIMPLLEDKDEPGYVYNMLGKFSDIDEDKQILYLQTKKGDRYGFKYEIPLVSELVYREKIGDKVVNVPFGDKPINIAEPIMVQWADTRKLEEIINTAKTDDRYNLVDPNISGSDLLLVIKIK